ncbi:predicted protein [Coccidioides posadasii str. Silveira]|uniref:Predicted protein n=2 Tax=Coccidioides posadasii TaxID=199306 RepID=E9D0J2_COCPS|nr:predicted protein [Coccidioides posadasii str. Silveira]KMM73586.1 hypothetical protein CPAG_09873 [Coccidioides posadasii RMSCC 3488]
MLCAQQVTFKRVWILPKYMKFSCWEHYSSPDDLDSAITQLRLLNTCYTIQGALGTIMLGQAQPASHTHGNGALILRSPSLYIPPPVPAFVTIYIYVSSLEQSEFQPQLLPRIPENYPSTPLRPAKSTGALPI